MTISSCCVHIAVSIYCFRVLQGRTIPQTRCAYLFVFPFLQEDLPQPAQLQYGPLMLARAMQEAQLTMQADVAFRPLGSHAADAAGRSSSPRQSQTVSAPQLRCPTHQSMACLMVAKLMHV